MPFLAYLSQTLLSIFIFFCMLAKLFYIYIFRINLKLIQCWCICISLNWYLVFIPSIAFTCLSYNLFILYPVIQLVLLLFTFRGTNHDVCLLCRPCPWDQFWGHFSGSCCVKINIFLPCYDWKSLYFWLCIWIIFDRVICQHFFCYSAPYNKKLASLRGHVVYMMYEIDPFGFGSLFVRKFKICLFCSKMV